MLKAIKAAAVFGGVFLMTSDAFAQAYFSRQAQQNRQYKSLSQATQRAFATPQRTTPTYNRPVTTTRSRSYR
jgi:hypothetical protein